MKEVRALRVPEAAHRLGLAKGTLRNMCHEGRVPYIKMGGAIAFRSDVIDRLLKEGIPLAEPRASRIPKSKRRKETD